MILSQKGNIYGGVIWTDVVRYDIYGKDVVIANKMEANGQVGNIMVSASTKKLLDTKYPNSYIFEEFKSVEIPSINETVVGYLVYPLFNYDEHIIWKLLFLFYIIWIL